jgi:hypothetical protein
VIGRIYLERGRPVIVLIAFVLPSKARPLPPCPDWLTWRRPPKGPPRNVLIQYLNGDLVVRSFRGLRRADPDQITICRHQLAAGPTAGGLLISDPLREGSS